MAKLTVDFILQEAGEDAMPPAEAPNLICFCGSRNFVLVSEMMAGGDKGIPASRMYECSRCGAYKLG